jgi:hypothetical protein
MRRDPVAALRAPGLDDVGEHGGVGLGLEAIGEDGLDPALLHDRG